MLADITAAVAFEEDLGNLNLVYRSERPVSLVQREVLKVHYVFCSNPCDAKESST